MAQTDFISIHAPPRGATKAASRILLGAQRFQFTPLREGRRVIRKANDVWLAISIHAPPRGATRIFKLYPRKEAYFNSRPSARGDGIAESEPRRLAISIHAPPRGATNAVISTSTENGISIHAPPRGATVRHFLHVADEQISIHAPPRGATYKEKMRKWTICYFNSRPSARGDFFPFLSGCFILISIHAPPRGATLSIRILRTRYSISIHAPPRGAT